MNDAKTYDVIVLGGGRGGMNLVVQLAAAGKKVLLVEKDRAMIGGSCINIACIPTKAFIACARRLAQCKGAKAFGINSEGNKADWLAIRRRVEDITSSFRSSNQSLVDQKENIHFVVGFGRFCGDKTIEIETENKKFIKATAADIVVNTGTRLLTAIKKRDNPAIVCAKVVKPCAPLPLKSPNLRSSKNRGERKGAVTRRLFFLSSLAS